jgi:hypothetical protein
LLGFEQTRNIGHLNNPAAGALWDSLSAIKHAQIRLRHLKRTCTSPTVLTSQVELCEVLLDEISGIRSSLAKDLKETRAGAMPTFDDTATKEFYFSPGRTNRQLGIR